MTFPSGNTKDENDAFFNNYGNTATGSYANKVYFGTTKSTTAKGIIRGQKINITSDVDKTLSINEAKRLYLTDEALRNKWNTALRKNGITADPIQARAIWDLSVDGASDWYATSNGQQKITPYQYLTWYAGGQKKKEPAIPTRQIYDITPEQIDADIEEIAVKRLGRTLQDEDRQADWYQDLIKGVQKLYAEGVVSPPSEIVTNKKTGKQERLVRQTPQFSKEKVEQKITTAVEAADPVSLERKKRIDNTKWLLSQGGQR